MGTISANKLGGLSLIVGPVLALVFYFLAPGGLLIDAADPADAAANIGATLANTGLAHITAFVIPLGLIVLFYGVHTLAGSLRGGNGEALSGYSVILWLLATVGWVLTAALTHVIAGDVGPAAGALYAISLGVGQMSSVLFALAALTLSLAISTRDDFNKITAYVIAVVSVVILVTAIIGGMDKTQLELTNQIGGIGYMIFTLWSITLGLTLVKKG
jgi:hypothetical protein